MNVDIGRSIGASTRQYWPEIDGLRTVAVVAVLVFHFNRSILPGGFVGVDVFFVISGFLIGSILLDDIAVGRFSIARFYQRRISRIFPAAFLVIGATLIAAALFYSAQDLASLGINAAAAATSLINFKLLAQHGYFGMSADAQPLLHYWSLAVEEQFYLVFPLLLALMMRFVKRPLPIMLALTGLSFVCCVAVTWINPTIAFYMLPTRAWELLAGSSLALAQHTGRKMPDHFAAPSAWAGAALILLSVVAIDETARFPGWIAALPVLGTVLLIAPAGGTKAWPLRFLSHPWMIAIGLRSYSLYLWHWPVFSFVDYRLFESSDLERGALKVALTLVLTELSYRFVETRARPYLNKPARRWYVFAGTASVILALAVGGSQMRNALYFDVSPRTIASGGTVVAGGDKGMVVLAGDSEAAMYGTEIASIARERGFTLHAVGVAGRNELPGAQDTLWPIVSDYIARTKPDVVILINQWSTKLTNPEPLRQAISESLAHAKQVIVVTQPPILAENVSRDSIRAGLRPPYREPAEQTRRRMATNAMIASFASDRVTVVAVADIFALPDGSVRVIGADQRMTFKDSYHLSDSGTVMTHPRLERAISQALAAN